MLIILSLEHGRSGVAEREPFLLPVAERRRLTRAARRLCGGQLAFLVTCNRIELTTWVPSPHPATAKSRIAALAERLAPHLAAGFLARARLHAGADAMRHLAEVAAGLRSQVPGDDQVLGQVRAAYAEAAAGPELHRLFQAALRTGKRVRAETAFGRRDASVGALAVRALGDVRGRRVTVVGAGVTAARAARALVAGGAEVVITNRSLERAEALAERLGAHAVSFEERYACLAASDYGAVATGALTPVITAAELAAARVGRGGVDRPLTLFDLSAPRNVEPAVAGLRGVRLHDLDALRPEDDACAARRAAEGIVEEEVAAFTRWIDGRTGRALVA